MQTLIYARVSKSDGSQDVERQLVELREFAQKQNWNVVENCWRINQVLMGTI